MFTGGRNTVEFPSRVNLSGPVCTVPSSTDRTSRCNKVDAEVRGFIPLNFHKFTTLVVSLLSDFPKGLIYVPCGISQDWIARLPSLNACHNKKEDSKVPNVYFSEPSI